MRILSPTAEPGKIARAEESRKWPRYALPVSLVAALLLLPWGITTFRGWREKASAIREIDALNGMATSRYRFGRVGRTPVEFGPLESVYFLGPQLNDRNLEVLRKVPELRILNLTNTQVTDDGLAILSEFPNLNALSVANIDYVNLIGPAGARLNTVPQFSGKGLAALRGLTKLESIQLIGPITTDADLMAVRELKSLLFVDLKDTSVTDVGVAELKNALPDCVIRQR